jgi:hypothetical protein
LSRLPGQIGLAWLVCRHAASVRGLRMATGTRYRCKLIHALETSGNKKHWHANGMPRLTLFLIARGAAGRAKAPRLSRWRTSFRGME